MEPGSLTRRADGVIARLAARQHGVVARWQLLDAGVTPQQIKVRLRSGRLHKVHRGVYLVGHSVPPVLAMEQAALLLCSDPVALSDRSAANLWNLLPYPATAPVCVTVPPERSVARPGIKVHRSKLTRRDLRRRHGLAVASPPRTILDLARSLDEEKLERVVAEASYRGLASEAELRAQVERNEGRRGVGKLRHVLDLPCGPRRTRSPAERMMLRLLRRAGITGYEMNARIHGYEVDLLWRAEGVAVEIDGYDAHSGRVAFERDHLKSATLGAYGIRVVPVTARQIRDDPAGVLDRLFRTLVKATKPAE